MTPAALWTPRPMASLLPSLNLWQFGPRQFRCAQPVPADVAQLAGLLRLTTLLDLTEDIEHDVEGKVIRTLADHDAESAACLAVPINSARVPMDGVECPTQLQISEAIGYLGVGALNYRTVIDPNAPGCLIHCTHGEDRSGVVCACYQLAAGMSIWHVLDDFKRGHVRGDGLVGEYWMISAILEFSRRIK